jgi:pre-mRNA-splicing helicase BRR2
MFSADPDARCVYVTPSQDTARLRYEEWEARFGAGLGKAVVELTGELTSDLKVRSATV